MFQATGRCQTLKRSVIIRCISVLAFFTAVYLLLPYQRGLRRQEISHDVAQPSESVNRTGLNGFWISLEAHMRQAKPVCPRISANKFCSMNAQFESNHFISFGACNRRDMVFMPGQHEKPRADHIRLDDASFNCLKASHDAMAVSAGQLSGTLPYAKGTDGIVMVGGGKYTFLVVLSLRMLRLTGSKLPVEVFLASSEEYDEHICESLLPSLNAKCRILSDTLSVTPHAATVHQYQFKALAILFSSFDNLLFLDADAFVVLPPDPLFVSEPFRSTGLVTWPDLWAETSSPLFFQIAGLAVPPVKRYSSDSGVIMYSKAKHAASLLLATYYNYYGPDHYYPLLSQGAFGQGDKETYLHAAVALRMDFWDIKTPIWQLGQWLSPARFQRVGMAQHYPEDDYERSAGDVHRKKEAIRPFVMHVNNPWKLIPTTIFNWWRSPTSYGGKQIRILGTEEDMIETFGYDFEAVMWEQVELVACELQVGCDTVKDYYKAVFGAKPTTRS